ncbi:MAG TPA: hypothetical protein PJ992_08075 [Arachnia sp.]|nr:hypothetical protein [Arachnia sp.]HMR13777.1 hypothetical protein [Arachnia sp.]
MILRRIACVLLLAPVLTVVGCASGTTLAGPSSPVQTPTPPPTEPAMQADAAWLDDGRLLGVVTWGSSSCVPVAEAATASGQEITVALTDPEGRPCTKDLAPRASLVGVPAGVNPREDVTLALTYLDQTVRFEIDGDDDLTGVPGEPTDYAPSAGWFDDEKGVVLLTWGSSSCTPIVENIDEADDAITVTFKANEGACTMDMGPRLTVLGVSGAGDDQQLVLVGDNLDATLPIRG